MFLEMRHRGRDCLAYITCEKPRDLYTRRFRSRHVDYEDDLPMATAHAIGGRAVVMCDGRLLSRFTAERCTSAHLFAELAG